MALTVIANNTTGQTAAMLQAQQLLKRAQASSPESIHSDRQEAKAIKAGKDFESILLGSWLTQAENTFAKVPGTDDDNQDTDQTNEQFQGLAMQALAGKLTASGGIGIARMITANLRKAHGGVAPTPPAGLIVPPHA
jgi:Rod binding domain-containing protein